MEVREDKPDGVFSFDLFLQWLCFAATRKRSETDLKKAILETSYFGGGAIIIQ
jgi:hypothetical protein